MIHLLFVLLLMPAASGLCDEISMVDKQMLTNQQVNQVDEKELEESEAKVSAAIKPTESVAGNNVKATQVPDEDVFVQQEEDRVKALKLLNLDVEKESLELKRREIQSKMAQLSHLDVDVLPATPGSDTKKAAVSLGVRVLSIMVTGDLKEAVMVINGNALTVHEGDVLKNGYSIKNIEPGKVIFTSGDGNQEEVDFNS